MLLSRASLLKQWAPRRFYSSSATTEEAAQNQQQQHTDTIEPPPEPIPLSHMPHMPHMSHMPPPPMAQQSVQPVQPVQAPQFQQPHLLPQHPPAPPQYIYQIQPQAQPQFPSTVHHQYQRHRHQQHHQLHQHNPISPQEISPMDLFSSAGLDKYMRKSQQEVWSTLSNASLSEIIGLMEKTSNVASVLSNVGCGSSGGSSGIVNVANTHAMRQGMYDFAEWAMHLNMYASNLFYGGMSTSANQSQHPQHPHLHIGIHPHNSTAHQIPLLPPLPPMQPPAPPPPRAPDVPLPAPPLQPQPQLQPLPLAAPFVTPPSFGPLLTHPPAQPPLCQPKPPVTAHQPPPVALQTLIVTHPVAPVPQLEAEMAAKLPSLPFDVLASIQDSTLLELPKNTTLANDLCYGRLKNLAVWYDQFTQELGLSPSPPDAKAEFNIVMWLVGAVQRLQTMVENAKQKEHVRNVAEKCGAAGHHTFVMPLPREQPDPLDIGIDDAFDAIDDAPPLKIKHTCPQHTSLRRFLAENDLAEGDTARFLHIPLPSHCSQSTPPPPAPQPQPPPRVSKTCRKNSKYTGIDGAWFSALPDVAYYTPTTELCYS